MFLIIIGAGGHGAVACECTVAAGHRVLGFLDDNGEFPPSILGLPVLGTTSRLEEYIAQGAGVVLGIGDNELRAALLARVTGLKAQLPVIVHPHTWVSPTATLGAGTVLVNGAMVNARAAVGSGCLLNTSCSVDHDCRLGDGVHICPGARLGGNVKVGPGSFIGMGAAVREGVEIGSRCLVAAGAVVVRDVPDRLRVAGVPARPLRK